MLCGSASCTSRLCSQSTTARAPSGSSAPSSTAAYSTWRKQVSSSALVVGRVSPSGIVNGGEVL